VIKFFSRSPNAYLRLSASGGWDIPRLCDGDAPLCVTSKLHSIILRVYGHLSKLLGQIKDGCDARNPTKVETGGSYNFSSTNIGWPCNFMVVMGCLPAQLLCAFPVAFPEASQQIAEWLKIVIKAVDE
jgi:hypothetical protein